MCPNYSFHCQGIHTLGGEGSGSGSHNRTEMKTRLPDISLVVLSINFSASQIIISAGPATYNSKKKKKTVAALKPTSLKFPG